MDMSRTIQHSISSSKKQDQRVAALLPHAGRPILDRAHPYALYIFCYGKGITTIQQDSHGLGQAALERVFALKQSLHLKHYPIVSENTEEQLNLFKVTML